MCKPFLIGYKRHPPGFQNFKFLSFSVYTTLLEPKQTNNKKTSYINAHYKAGERFQVCSVFIHPVERLFSSVGRIFQPERATLTDNNFENQLLCYVNQNW